MSARSFISVITKYFAAAGTITADELTGDEWNFAVGSQANLFNRLRKMSLTLGDAADIFVGLQTSADDVFIMDLLEERKQTCRVRSKALRAELVLEKDLLMPVISGTDVQRYAPFPRRQVILFPYEVADEEATLIDLSAIAKRYPRTAAYLTQNRKRLAQREGGKFDDRKWYRFGRNQNLGIQSRVKLCVPRLVEELHAAWDMSGEFFLDNVDVGGVTLKPQFASQSLAYMLTLINSRLMRWFFPLVSAPFRGGYRSANRQFLSQCPFRALRLDIASEQSIQATIIQAVNQRQQIEARRIAARSDRDRDFLGKQAAALDHRLDEIIYRLYELTPEEVSLVENSTT